MFLSTRSSFSSDIQTCDSIIFMLRNELSGQSKGQLQTRQTLALQLPCVPSHLRPVWITVHPISITFTKTVFGTLLGCFGFGLVVTCITLDMKLQRMGPLECSYKNTRARAITAGGETTPQCKYRKWLSLLNLFDYR